MKSSRTSLKLVLLLTWLIFTWTISDSLEQANLWGHQPEWYLLPKPPITIRIQPASVWVVFVVLCVFLSPQTTLQWLSEYEVSFFSWILEFLQEENLYDWYLYFLWHLPQCFAWNIYMSEFSFLKNQWMNEWMDGRIDGWIHFWIMYLNTINFSNVW